MNRRTFLQQSGALAGLGLAGLAGCGKSGGAPAAGGVKPLPYYDAVGPIVPIRAHVDRIFRTTVCLRPFRAAGPRMDVEHVGNKVVVHNYGHGYGLFYKDLYVIARRDGIVVQPVPGGDDFGWNDTNEEPNRQQAEAGVLLLRELFDRMETMRRERG